MRPLEEEARLRLLRIAAGLCAASILLAPMAGRTSLGLRTERQAFDRPIAAPASTAPKRIRISLLRDPFRLETESPQSSHAAPTMPVVRAVVTGRDAAALVEDAGTTRIVRAGDSVGGQIVTSIDAGGVHFEPDPASAAARNP